MKKLCNYLAAACLLVCGCIFAFETQARVCFATDENCGSGGNFPAKSDVDPNDEACKQEGYEKDKVCEKGYFKYNCPYKSSYVKCCEPKYSYAVCIYPMESAGKCGNKYNCICPSSRFPYTGDMCQNNSILGGRTCLQQNGGDENISIHYEKCVCDTGVYPYMSDNECGENQIVDPSKSCKDSDRVEHYRRCKCRNTWSTCAAMGPAIGTKKCFSDGATYYENCCQCPDYELNMHDGHALEYEACPCNGSYLKVKTCEEGYKVKNGRCVEVTCEDAVQDWIDRSSSRQANYKIVKDASDASTKYLNYIYLNNVSPTWMRYGTNHYSASYFGKLKGDSNIKLKCKGTPRVTFNYSNFDDGSSNETIFIYGLELVLPKNITANNKKIYLYNVALNAANMNVSYLSASTDSYYDPYNEATPIIKAGDMYVSDYFYLYGVDTDINLLKLRWGAAISPSSFKANKLKVIGENGSFTANGGNYYVVRTEIGACDVAPNCSKGTFCRVSVVNRAQWYMQGDASTNHEVQVERCSGFGIDFNSRLIGNSYNRACTSSESGHYAAWRSNNYDKKGNRGFDANKIRGDFDHVKWYNDTTEITKSKCSD